MNNYYLFQDLPIDALFYYGNNRDRVLVKISNTEASSFGDDVKFVNAGVLVFAV